MSDRRYCSKCGHLTRRQWVPAESRERDFCTACRSIHYNNPKVLVAGIVHWCDAIVLCRRADEPAKGCWSVPMGYVELGESLEEAVSRELHEETGLRVSPSAMTLYAVSSVPHINQVHVVYRSQLMEPRKPISNQESLGVRLFSEAAIPYSELAFFELMKDPFATFFRQLSNGFFSVISLTLRP